MKHTERVLLAAMATPAVWSHVPMIDTYLLRIVHANRTVPVSIILVLNKLLFYLDGCPCPHFDCESLEPPIGDLCEIPEENPDAILVSTLSSIVLHTSLVVHYCLI